MLGVASTDAVNRAPMTAYSEVTGITQTARNFGASLGLAILGTILISRNKTNITSALTNHGVPHSAAQHVAGSFGASGAVSAPASGQPLGIPHDVQLAFAQSTQTVFYIMACVLAATFVITLLWLPRGRVIPPEEVAEAGAADVGLGQA